MVLHNNLFVINSELVLQHRTEMFFLGFCGGFHRDLLVPKLAHDSIIGEIKTMNNYRKILLALQKELLQAQETGEGRTNR